MKGACLRRARLFHCRLFIQKTLSCLAIMHEEKLRHRCVLEASLHYCSVYCRFVERFRTASPGHKSLKGTNYHKLSA